MVERVPVAAGVVVPGTDAHVVHVEGGPRAGSPYYDLRIGLGGGAPVTVGVPVYGLVAAPVRADLVHLPALDLRDASVEIGVTYRWDPSAPRCVLTLAGQCVATNPVGSTSWLLRGAAAMLVVHARVVDTAGGTVAEQWLTVPYAGQAVGVA